MALWHLGFLLHAQDFHVVVELDDTGALEFFYRRLLVAHDARSALFLGEFDKFAKGEEEEVVSGNDKEIVKTL